MLVGPEPGAKAKAPTGATDGADAAEECEGASFDDPHFVFIAAGGGVIVGVKSTDDTGEGFCEGAEVVGIAFEGE